MKVLSLYLAGVLPPLSEAILTFTVAVSPTLSGLITNTVSITAANFEIDGSDNITTETTLIEAAAASPTPTPTPTETPTPTATMTPTPVTSDIHVLVWNDLNRNGLRDSGEPALAGVEVAVDRVGATRSTERTVTGSDGYAHFNDRAAPAIYKLTEVDPPYAISTTPNEVSVSVAPGMQADITFGDLVLPNRIFLPNQLR